MTFLFFVTLCAVTGTLVSSSPDDTPINTLDLKIRGSDSEGFTDNESDATNPPPFNTMDLVLENTDKSSYSDNDAQPDINTMDAKAFGSGSFSEDDNEDQNSNINTLDIKTGGSGNSDFQTRVIGGREAGENEFPHQVHLGPAPGRRGSVCGGSIIANNWVLTAAHCVVDANTKQVTQPSQVMISTGNVDDRRQPIRLRVEKIIPHPQYGKTQINLNDVALMKVRGNLIKNGVTAKAQLPQPNESFIGQNVVASGFGRTNPDPSVPSQSPVLKALDVRVLPDQSCKSVYGAGYVPSMMVCVGGKPGQNVCNGDSGGPLTLKSQSGNIVVGIASFVRDVHCRDPAVFTKVSYHISFINQVMRSN